MGQDTTALVSSHTHSHSNGSTGIPVADPSVLPGGAVDILPLSKSVGPRGHVFRQLVRASEFTGIINLSDAAPIRPLLNGSMTKMPGGVATALGQVLIPFGRDAEAISLEKPAGSRFLTVEDYNSKVRGGEIQSSTAIRLQGVQIRADVLEGYYGKVANGSLWPLMHSLLDKVRPIDPAAFANYEEVNLKFAKMVCTSLSSARHPEATLVWVHDYQLMLASNMIRNERMDANIGYFHHIPFPKPEVLFDRELIGEYAHDLVRGVLGADYVAFQTPKDADNFLEACAYIGLTASAAVEPSDGLGPRVVGHVWVPQGETTRRVAVAAVPISIDWDNIMNIIQKSDVRMYRDQARQSYAIEGKPLLMSIDRFDYTKGILERVNAIDLMLSQDPSLIGEFSYFQSAAPTRVGVPVYDSYRASVNEAIERVNAKHKTANWKPVYFCEQSIEESAKVMGYLQAADTVVVTPLFDGHNLLAKEAVAASFHPIQLILGEGAGASIHLRRGAIMVDGCDIQQVANGIKTSINRFQMAATDSSFAEINRSWASMIGAIQSYGATDWTRNFLSQAFHATKGRFLNPNLTTAHDH